MAIEDDKEADESESDGLDCEDKCFRQGSSCKNCMVCCFGILAKYNLHIIAYSNIFVAYKFVLTLSSTQVKCETSFSKLKIIKNRLRSSLSQENLEAFLLMSIEKNILVNLNVDLIINEICKKAEGIKTYLEG